MAAQVGAQYLERPHGGRGILLGGVECVALAKLFIIGAGVVGTNAVLIAIGMKADVTVTAAGPASLQAIKERFGGDVRTVASIPETIDAQCRAADLVVATALIPGAAVQGCDCAVGHRESRTDKAQRRYVTSSY
jgi:alanine dehydrogenase